MKRSEVALLLVVVGLVVLSTYFFMNAFLGQSTLKPVNQPVAKPIVGHLDNKPDPAVFNDNAINPAVNVTIGDQANQQPFTIGQ